MHKLAVGRDPLTGAALASQPTLSRFENAMGPRALYRMGRTLAATVIAQHRHRLKGRARRITIDLDPTDDPTHGQQALGFFNGHYDTWCSLPLVATLTFNDEAEQYLVAVMLRPGNSPAKHGAFGLLRTLLRQLRQAFPGTPLRVRVDGGFAGNDWLDFLEVERVEYCGGAGLQPAAGAAGRSLAGRGLRPVQVQRPHGACLRGDPRCGPKLVAPPPRDHQSRSGSAPWAGSQMQSALCRNQSPRDARPPAMPSIVSEATWRTGSRSCIDGLALDRTSGSQFWANQFRVLLTTAAYVLLQALRQQAHGTDCARAQVSTLRERLLKMAVWVERSVRRIVLHLPRTAPWGTTWHRGAVAVGAVPG